MPPAMATRRATPCCGPVPTAAPAAVAAQARERRVGGRQRRQPVQSLHHAHDAPMIATRAARRGRGQTAHFELPGQRPTESPRRSATRTRRSLNGNL